MLYSNVKPARRLIEDILGDIPSDDLLMKAVAACAALGLHNAAISKALGVTLSSVEEKHCTPECQKTITNIQISIGMSPEQMVAAQITRALEIKARHLNSSDDKLAAKTATEIIERYMGKATQTVVNVNQSISTATSTTDLDKKLAALNDRLDTVVAQRTKLKELKKLSALPASAHAETNQVL